jgi:hypothetical protein
MKTMQENILESMTSEYQIWLDDNKFPQISADELIADSDIIKTEEQEMYLISFIDYWNYYFNQ